MGNGQYMFFFGCHLPWALCVLSRAVTQLSGKALAAGGAVMDINLRGHPLAMGRRLRQGFGIAMNGDGPILCGSRFARNWQLAGPLALGDSWGDMHPAILAGLGKRLGLRPVVFRFTSHAMNGRSSGRRRNGRRRNGKVAQAFMPLGANGWQ